MAIRTVQSHSLDSERFALTVTAKKETQSCRMSPTPLLIKHKRTQMCTDRDHRAGSRAFGSPCLLPPPPQLPPMSDGRRDLPRSCAF